LFGNDLGCDFFATVRGICVGADEFSFPYRRTRPDQIGSEMAHQLQSFNAGMESSGLT